MKTDFADTYDQWADLYAYIHGSFEEGAAYFERTVGARLAELLPEGGRVLDVGCGIGLSTAGLLKSGFNVVGIDISPRSLERAAENLRAFEGQVEFLEKDALDLDDYAGSFDAVVAVSSLCEHFISEEQQRQLLAGFVKSLKLGGVLLLDSYDHENAIAGSPDDQLTEAKLVNLPTGTVLYTERRRFTDPKDKRLYEREFRYFDDNDVVSRIEMQGRALFLQEYTRWVKAAGMTGCRWFGPGKTGYYKHMFTALKAPSDPPEEQSVPRTDKPDRNVLTAKIKPADLPPNIFEEEVTVRRQTLFESRNDKGEAVFQRRNQATLVMFSGGIDSTYSLVKLLRESGDDVIAHHIHFINPENRHRAEAEACSAIVNHLKKTERFFLYTESTIDRRRFKSFGMDEVAVGFEVGIVSRSFEADRGHPIDRWTSGICLEEELDDFGSSDIEQMQHSLNCAAAAAFPCKPPRFFQIPIIGKKEQMDYMGQEIVDLCWTCRSPVWRKDGTAKECGKCKTCLVMNDIRSGRPTIADGF